MTGTLPPFSYVGPPDLAAETANAGATGRDVRMPHDLDRWVATQCPAELDEPFTYVVSLEGMLLLAPRRSEHVACAGGADVLAAGEIGLARRPDDGWRVSEVSNLSTGYCPDPDCWPAVADALDRVGVDRPDGFTHAFVFRRCPECRQINVVKGEDFACAVCGRILPQQWNVDPMNSRARHSAAAVIDLPVPDDALAEGWLAPGERWTTNRFCRPFPCCQYCPCCQCGCTTAASPRWCQARSKTRSRRRPSRPGACCCVPSISASPPTSR